MALVTVEGVFRDGVVELAEAPSGVSGEARVLVTFLRKPDEDSVHEGEKSDTDRKRAVARLIERMEEGISLGGPPYPRREEIYDRVQRFIERDR